MNINKVKTGRLIAEQRKALNMTQSELAEKLHISPKAVSKWERAQNFPSVDMLKNLAEVLQVQVNDTKDNSNDLTNAIETKTLRTSVSDGKGNRCIVPVIAFIDWYAMRKLYKYDYEYLYVQINCSEINECTTNQINHAALKLISAYDENGDIKLLEIAQYYLDKIYDLEKEKEYYMVNLLQIKKRLGTFKEMDALILNSWNDQSIDLNFAKYVLLEDITNAKEYWEKLEDKYQKEMCEYPIYNLYNKLIKNEENSND